MNSKFKVGDKVRVRKDLIVDKQYGADNFVSDMRCMLGEVVTIENVIGASYRIKECGFNWTDEMFESEKVKNYKLIFKDKATILFKDGKKYVAKCCDGDTYDREKRFIGVFSKANGITFNDLQEMLKSAEEPNGKVREVKREAKVGEYIKVVDEQFACGYYNNGDIIKVRKVSYDGYVMIQNDWSIAPKEYVVLENYKPSKYKITLSEFLDRKTKIAVNLKTVEEYDKFINACQKKGRFVDWDKKTYTREEARNRNFCVGYGFLRAEGWCDKKWYLGRGAKIYNFNEVDLNN